MAEEKEGVITLTVTERNLWVRARHLHVNHAQAQFCLTAQHRFLIFNSNFQRWLFLSDERLGKKSDSEELPDFKNRPGKFMSSGYELIN